MHYEENEGIQTRRKLRPGRKAIGNHWVLEFKEDNKGRPVQKAGLVAQGFSQLVIKTASVHFITALACWNDWELDTFDAMCAFLWGVLKEEIYMTQPKGFEEGNWALLVWQMLKTIYSLPCSFMTKVTQWVMYTASWVGMSTMAWKLPTPNLSFTISKNALLSALTSRTLAPFNTSSASSLNEIIPPVSFGCTEGTISPTYLMSTTSLTVIQFIAPQC